MHEYGKERSVINPAKHGAYMQEDASALISRGYGVIKAEELIEATRAPRMAPRDGMSYLMPTVPASQQQAFQVKEDHTNNG